VCRSWRAAAAEATTAIHVDYSEYLASEDPGDEEEAEGNIANSLARWLEKHGGALTELNLTGSEGGIIDFRLPFQRLTQLQDLRLDECYLHEYEYTSQGNADQPSSSSSSAGPLAGLSSLTYLDLADVAFAWPGSGDALSALTNLRELRLYSVQLGGEEEPAPNLDMLLPLQQLTALTVAAHPMIEEPGARVLAQLTGLRQLSIQHMEMTPKAMESFVALTNLTQLQCSYESFELQPQKFKTFRAVSEVRTSAMWAGKSMLQLASCSVGAEYVRGGCAQLQAVASCCLNLQVISRPCAANPSSSAVRTILLCHPNCLQEAPSELT
jgi:hypothetical protein